MEMVKMPEREKSQAMRVEYMETRYPAYMQYETSVGKKENYLTILADFKEMREKLFDKEKGLVYDSYEDGKPAVLEDGKFKTVSMGYYLMGVIDTMSAVAQEIYEQYKVYERMFKEAVKGVLRYYNEKEGIFHKYTERLEKGSSAVQENPIDAVGSLMIAYALFKGCLMHALLSEKYIPIAKQLYLNGKARASEDQLEEGLQLAEQVKDLYEQWCNQTGEEKEE